MTHGAWSTVHPVLSPVCLLNGFIAFWALPSRHWHKVSPSPFNLPFCTGPVPQSICRHRACLNKTSSRSSSVLLCLSLQFWMTSSLPCSIGSLWRNYSSHRSSTLRRPWGLSMTAWPIPLLWDSTRPAWTRWADSELCPLSITKEFLEPFMGDHGLESNVRKHAMALYLNRAYVNIICSELGLVPEVIYSSPSCLFVMTTAQRVWWYPCPCWWTTPNPKTSYSASISSL